MESSEILSADYGLSSESLIIQKDNCRELFSFCYANSKNRYRVLLEADISEVSLEGMNQFLITISDENKSRGDSLCAALEINLREEMNGVSVDGGKPHFFTITGHSLDIVSFAIDSSIHDVVDLGIIDQQILQGVRPGSSEHSQSILLDFSASTLLKASISVLLAQSASCHQQVIREAGHLFASRQDYVRDMCNCIAQNAESTIESISGKARAVENQMAEQVP